jgi:ABC-type lipoprotein release transport system permease subunit
MSRDNDIDEFVVFISCIGMVAAMTVVYFIYIVGRSYESESIERMCLKYGHTQIYDKEFDCSERKQ